MIDIQSYFKSLKASWVNRLVTGKFCYWKLIPMKYFSHFGDNWLIFKTSNGEIKYNNKLKKLPEFYRDVFVQWSLTGEERQKNLKTSLR